MVFKPDATFLCNMDQEIMIKDIAIFIHEPLKIHLSCDLLALKEYI
jgi:hypothetical protein